MKLERRTRESVEWRKPVSTTGLSYALDIFDGGYAESTLDAILLLEQAQTQLAILDTEHDLRKEAQEAFSEEEKRFPGQPLQEHRGQGMPDEYFEVIRRNDEEKVTRWMAQKVIERCDPRVNKDYMDRYYNEVNERIDRYVSHRA